MRLPRDDGMSSVNADARSRRTHDAWRSATRAVTFAPWMKRSRTSLGRVRVPERGDEGTPPAEASGVQVMLR